LLQHICFRPRRATRSPPPGMIPSCREAGILGAVVGVIGTLQAVEALNLLAQLKKQIQS